jgi:hypothetical protein
MYRRTNALQSHSVVYQNELSIFLWSVFKKTLNLSFCYRIQHTILYQCLVALKTITFILFSVFYSLLKINWL